MVGVTAFAAVRAVAAGPGDTVVVSAAAGGVGSIVVQLLQVRGARVVGIASEAHHAWLIAHGVIPVHYGDGLADRLRDAAEAELQDRDLVARGVDREQVGVPLQRIETIISFAAAQELGTKAEGSGDATSTEVLAEMAGLVAAGRIEIPIAATYHLDQVREAYTELEQRHTRGKIVLVP